MKTVSPVAAPKTRKPLSSSRKASMSKADRVYLQKVAALGCIVCRLFGHGITPAELTAIHHIRDGQGGAQRASHQETLPLCGPHHQTGGYGIAIHAGQEEWERRYGTERELLDVVKELLREQEALQVGAILSASISAG